MEYRELHPRRGTLLSGFAVWPVLMAGREVVSQKQGWVGKQWIEQLSARAQAQALCPAPLTSTAHRKDPASAFILSLA